MQIEGILSPVLERFFPMTAFTLGVHNVPAAEVALIKTLVRLFAHDPSFQWRFSDTGPFDAVLTDATSVAGHPPASLARAVLKITRATAAADADCISRPIRAEQLKAWLASQEQRLSAQTTKPSAEPKRPAAKSGGLRFKLRRWPSATLLKNDPQRIRLATLLARRALGARELSTISQLPAQQCQDFVETLRQADLLEVLETPATAAASTSTAPVRPIPQTSFAHSLITGIRRRLGL